MGAMRLLSRYRLIFILAVGLLCAALLLNEHLVPAGDNATYIVLGQSLATGRGYRMVSDPRQPEMALYPPGYPLLLAGVLAALQGGATHSLMAAVIPMKWVSVALYLAAIALVYALFWQRNATLATLAALLTALNPHILYYAAEVGTEMPYLLLSLGCVWLFERYWRKPTTGALLWTAGWLAVAFYVRSVALVMAAAFVLYLVVRRRLKHALLLLLLVGILAAPWFIRSSLLPATGTSVGLGRGYFALYSSSDPYGTARASLPSLVARLAQNLRMYALEIWPGLLLPHVSEVGVLLPALDLVLSGLMSLLLVVGWAVEARRGSASEWYVALFFLSCVGYLWVQGRLIVPIIPFAIYYLLSALDWLLTRALRERNKAHSLAIAVTCAALALSALAVDMRSIQRNLRFGLGKSVATYYSKQDADWRNYQKAVDWIVRDAQPLAALKTMGPVVVMCRKADLTYILTGFQALEYPYSTDGQQLMRAVRDNHVSYLIEDRFFWTYTTAEYMRPALQAWRDADPGAVSLAYELDRPPTRVWRVNQTE